jgi:peroxidase
MTMQFGQFLDHDITLTPQAGQKMNKFAILTILFTELDCCNQTFLALDQAQDSHLQRCLNIPVNLSTFDDTCSSGTCCHSFTRSDSICADSTHREQFNIITAFVDGSNVYGSDQETSNKLRVLTDGLMKTNPGFTIQNLPTRQHCGFSSPGSLTPLDLVAGDVRAIVQPTLASTHTLFLNEHNRVAQELKSRLGNALATFSSSEADEFLFQETRKIVGAELQNIVYREYLPVILGSNAMLANGLVFDDVTNYDPLTDPSILNEFATVAYRFGHSTVSDIINNWKLSSHFLQDSDVFVTGN